MTYILFHASLKFLKCSEENFIFNKKVSYICLLMLPIAVLIYMQSNYHSQFKTPVQEEHTKRFLIKDIEQIYALDEWKQTLPSLEDSSSTKYIQSSDKTNEFVRLTISLQLPAAEQIYKIHLDGLQYPFDIYVNNKLIKSISTFENKKRVSFYAQEQQVNLEVRIYSKDSKVSFLKNPLFGQSETMNHLELKEYIGTVFALLLLCSLSIYTLLLYFTRQHAKVFLYISSYLLLLAASLFLAGEQLGHALLSTISSVTLLKLKTIFALLSAISLYLLLGVIQKKQRVMAK